MALTETNCMQNNQSGFRPQAWKLLWHKSFMNPPRWDLNISNTIGGGGLIETGGLFNLAKTMVSVHSKSDRKSEPGVWHVYQNAVHSDVPGGPFTKFRKIFLVQSEVLGFGIRNTSLVPTPVRAIRIDKRRLGTECDRRIFPRSLTGDVKCEISKDDCERGCRNPDPADDWNPDSKFHR